MPLYEFECMPDFNGCGCVFEITCSMSEISELKPECPKCNQIDSVFRVWNCGISPPPKTLGSLADKNASKISSDEMKMLKEKYKTKKRGAKLKPIEKRLSDKY